MENVLSESLENYLEAIYEICLELPAARPKDISEALAVSGPSVTGALKALSERGLIDYAPFGLITLTEEGLKYARGVSRRHGVLRRFLVDILSVDAEEADAAACRLEHGISPLIFERLTALLDHLEVGGEPSVRWSDKVQGIVDKRGVKGRSANA